MGRQGWAEAKRQGHRRTYDSPRLCTRASAISAESGRDVRNQSAKSECVPRERRSAQAWAVEGGIVFSWGARAQIATGWRDSDEILRAGLGTSEKSAATNLTPTHTHTHTHTQSVGQETVGPPINVLARGSEIQDAGRRRGWRV